MATDYGFHLGSLVNLGARGMRMFGNRQRSRPIAGVRAKRQRLGAERAAAVPRAEAQPTVPRPEQGVRTAMPTETTGSLGFTPPKITLQPFHPGEPQGLYRSHEMGPKLTSAEVGRRYGGHMTPEGNAPDWWLDLERHVAAARRSAQGAAPGTLSPTRPTVAPRPARSALAGGVTQEEMVRRAQLSGEQAYVGSHPLTQEELVAMARSESERLYGGGPVPTKNQAEVPFMPGQYHRGAQGTLTPVPAITQEERERLIAGKSNRPRKTSADMTGESRTNQLMREATGRLGGGTETAKGREMMRRLRRQFTAEQDWRNTASPEAKRLHGYASEAIGRPGSLHAQVSDLKREDRERREKAEAGSLLHSRSMEMLEKQGETAVRVAEAGGKLVRRRRPVLMTGPDGKILKDKNDKPVWGYEDDYVDDKTGQPPEGSVPDPGQQIQSRLVTIKGELAELKGQAAIWRGPKDRAKIRKLEAEQEELEAMLEGEGNVTPPSEGSAGTLAPRAGGDGSSRSKPARPTTQAAYDALPSGAWFIQPDNGKLGRKP